MQLGEVAAAMPTIQKLMDSKVKAVIAFRLAKFAKQVEPHMESSIRFVKNYLKSMEQKAKLKVKTDK